MLRVLVGWLAIFVLAMVVFAVMFIRTAHGQESKPNVLVVMVDDFDATMYADFPEFQADAAVFPNFIYSTALCCPTRATLLTGMYSWNTDMWTNDPGEAKFRRRWEDISLPVEMQRQGYETAYFGKYMNGYEDNHVPRGWDHWSAFTRPPTKKRLNVNGKVRDSRGHYDDTTGRLAASWLRDREGPWYAVVSFYSPHGPRKIAQRHKALRPEGMHAKRVVSTLPAKEHFENLRSLVPPNTVVIFMTDNGYHLVGGRFTRQGKNTPFSTDAQVPISMWGPGITPGIYPQLVTTVDIFSTVTDFAGERVDRDGLSLRLYLNGVGAAERAYIPMFHRDYGWSIRTREFLYNDEGGKLYRVGSEEPGDELPVSNNGRFVQSLERLKNCNGSACVLYLSELQ